MNENKEWKMSLEDALREIHRQLTEDELFLNQRLQQDSFRESMPDEEMRIRRIFSLAVLMEETIDSVLKEIDNEPQKESELQSLEYTSHTIGTPDEETASPEIEDISIDQSAPDAEEAPEEEAAPAAADEEAPAPAEEEAEETAESGEEDDGRVVIREIELSDPDEEEEGSDAEEEKTLLPGKKNPAMKRRSTAMMRKRTKKRMTTTMTMTTTRSPS